MTEIGYDKYTYDQPFEFYSEWLSKKQQEKILKDWNNKYNYNYNDFEELSTKLMDTSELQWDMQFDELIALTNDLFTVDFGDDGDNNWVLLHKLYGVELKVGE